MNDTKIISLKGSKRFSERFRRGRKVYTAQIFASIYFRTSSEPDQKTQLVRLGVTIRKKTARRAVVRNRIKRLLREAFRRNLPKYITDNGFCPFETVILSWNSPVEKPSLIRLANVEPDVVESLDKAYGFFYDKFIKHNEIHI
ncbi:MAG: ribonuclease P protein component [Candidatus Kapaibacterium sp.]